LILVVGYFEKQKPREAVQ